MSSIEYDQVYDNTLRSIGGKNANDVFDDPITKEKVDDDLLKRAIKRDPHHSSKIENENESTFVPMVKAPVNEVVYRVMNTLITTSNDLYAGKDIRLVLDDDRRLYQGLFLVFTSLCFIVLYKA